MNPMDSILTSLGHPPSGNSDLSAQIKALQDSIGNLTAYSATPFNNDPFTVARSGLQAGGLQDYINRITGNANNALNGGLLGYSPSTLQAGSAGGQAGTFYAPQGGLLGLAARPWMQNFQTNPQLGNISPTAQAIAQVNQQTPAPTPGRKMTGGWFDQLAGWNNL